MGRIGNNTKVMRVDPEFDKIVREISLSNNLSLSQTTREIATTIKNIRGKTKITREIKF